MGLFAMPSSYGLCWVGLKKLLTVLAVSSMEIGTIQDVIFSPDLLAYP